MWTRPQGGAIRVPACLVTRSIGRDVLHQDRVYQNVGMMQVALVPKRTKGEAHGDLLGHIEAASRLVTSSSLETNDYCIYRIFHRRTTSPLASSEMEALR